MTDCCFETRERVDALYVPREERLNAASPNVSCRFCRSTNCNSLHYSEALGRHPICPNENSCRLFCS